jgi:hypothetical protein
VAIGSGNHIHGISVDWLPNAKMSGILLTFWQFRQKGSRRERPIISYHREEAMKPEKTFRVGLCSAAVFRNQVNGSGGETKEFLTVAVQRRYRDSERGDWKTATNFGHAELPQVLRALHLAQD